MSALFNMSPDRPDFSIELSAGDEGFSSVAGFDEAGRGALAGPLCVGMVLYPPSVMAHPPSDLIDAVRDSKALTLKGRLRALDVICRYALCAESVFISHKIIDSININQATRLGISRLVEKSSVKPDMILMDGSFRFDFSVHYRSVIKGDCRSLSISSASVVAKVARDRLMELADRKFPGYGFAAHKGYGTKKHRDAINLLGPSSVHRKTYEPVRSILSGQGDIFHEDK